MGRLVFLCGSAGSGKTTVGEALKRDHGFAHFDGDVWWYGLDPVAQSAQTPTPEQLKACPEEISRLRDAFVNGYFLKLAAGEQADLSAAESLYKAMARDVLRLRDGELAGRDMVVSHAVLERRMRDVLRRIYGPELVCVNLDVTHALLVERKARRLEENAAAQGKTMEDFVMADDAPHLGATPEERVEKLTVKASIPAEEVGDNEERAVSVAIDAGTDVAAMTAAVCARLGLAASDASPAATTLSLRQVIFDPRACAGEEVTVGGTVSMLDRKLGRMDISDDGAKLIVQIGRLDATVTAALAASSTVKVTGAVRKQQRRTFLDASGVVVTVPSRAQVASEGGG